MPLNALKADPHPDPQIPLLAPSSIMMENSGQLRRKFNQPQLPTTSRVMQSEEGKTQTKTIKKCTGKTKEQFKIHQFNFKRHSFIFYFAIKEFTNNFILENTNRNLNGDLL